MCQRLPCPPSLLPSLPHLLDMLQAVLFLRRPAPSEQKPFHGVNVIERVENVKEMGKVLFRVLDAEGRVGGMDE